MKKIILILLIVQTFTFGKSAYCEGFEAGYIAGYCYGEVYCAEPWVPFCPWGSMGESSYMDGYNRGFTIGLKKLNYGN